jgi:alanyl-tRNA synthetase
VRVVEAVIETYKDAYPDLITKQAQIISEIEKEEKKFRNTLEQGLKIFEEIVARSENNAISGKDAFDLNQSYGFPLEITEELAKERNFTVDIASFEEEKTKHQALSRAGAEQKFKGGLADTGEMSVKYHTATHLLHAALHKILGPQALQKGSNITAERMRFDFAHSEKMTPEQIKEAEDLVNAAIKRDYPVTFQELPLEEARKKQAIGLFADNYGEKVKVYTVGDPEGIPLADATSPTFSRELCGGPHVEHTGTMGHFKIVKEEACSSGIRRIKATLE